MTSRLHGPENAEFEIRKAYNVVIESAVPYFWANRAIPGVNANEALELYRRAFASYRDGNKLAAERWARASKHLARAFTAEAKIAYLEAHSSDLPFLASQEGDTPKEFDGTQGDTTEDLINSVADQVPVGFERMPRTMSRYLEQARQHLKVLIGDAYNHALLRAERIRAAYEYGRVLEIMVLAYEAEIPQTKRAA